MIRNTYATVSLFRLMHIQQMMQDTLRKLNYSRRLVIMKIYWCLIRLIRRFISSFPQKQSFFRHDNDEISSSNLSKYGWRCTINTAAITIFDERCNLRHRLLSLRHCKDRNPFMEGGPWHTNTKLDRQRSASPDRRVPDTTAAALLLRNAAWQVAYFIHTIIIIVIIWWRSWRHCNNLASTIP